MWLQLQQFIWEEDEKKMHFLTFSKTEVRDVPRSTEQQGFNVTIWSMYQNSWKSFNRNVNDNVDNDTPLYLNKR